MRINDCTTEIPKYSEKITHPHYTTTSMSVFQGDSFWILLCSRKAEPKSFIRMPYLNIYFCRLKGFSPLKLQFTLSIDSLPNTKYYVYRTNPINSIRKSFVITYIQNYNGFYDKIERIGPINIVFGIR